MDGLVEDGFILLGGPVGSGQQTMHVIEADDEDASRQRLAEDPCACAGLLTVGSIEPWALWLDFRENRTQPELRLTRTSNCRCRNPAPAAP